VLEQSYPTNREMGGDCLHVLVGFGNTLQIERNVNLRFRIILKALLKGAMRMTRSCGRPVDILDWEEGYLCSS
jgi:hypothetical protein